MTTSSRSAVSTSTQKWKNTFISITTKIDAVQSTSIRSKSTFVNTHYRYLWQQTSRCLVPQEEVGKNRSTSQPTETVFLQISYFPRPDLMDGDKSTTDLVDFQYRRQLKKSFVDQWRSHFKKTEISEKTLTCDYRLRWTRKIKHGCTVGPVAYLGFPVPGHKVSLSVSTVVNVLSLSRSGARNLAILWLCLCVRPAAVVLCLRFRIALLQSVLFVQLACPGKHSISYAVEFLCSHLSCRTLHDWVASLVN